MSIKTLNHLMRLICDSLRILLCYESDLGCPEDAVQSYQDRLFVETPSVEEYYIMYIHLRVYLNLFSLTNDLAFFAGGSPSPCTCCNIIEILFS